MAVVVQKFGGTSVADADRIRNVAARVVRTVDEGKQVVVVVSAMGSTTNELRGLAASITKRPPPRELDMLLSSGERISMALLAMAIDALGKHAESYTGSQAGIITDALHGSARISEVRPTRILDALDRGTIPIIAGFQGVSEHTLDITTLGKGASDLTAIALARRAPATTRSWAPPSPTPTMAALLRPCAPGWPAWATSPAMRARAASAPSWTTCTPTS
jgi:aspartate kinase